MRCAIGALAAALLGGLALHCAAGEADRRAELDRLLKILPRSEAWEKWLEKTGELPPAFAALPSVQGLPDPLVLVREGREFPVRSAADWSKKRAEILRDFHHYIFGTVPPPPGNVEATVVSSQEEEGSRTEKVELRFGPGRRAELSLEVFVPEGEGPFPVFLTQMTHRAWALVALGRGYVACTYAGCDSDDDTAAYVDVWPEHDWTKLVRRAFAASRCADYLEKLPYVDRGKIAITGHSRNGKLSLMASALDERFAAVISSSSGAGGADPYRLFSESQSGEGIEFITRVFPDWLHPRLRFFAGREDRLPVDNHELIALSAPRACLIATALNDNVESTWAIQTAYISAKRVYGLLGAAGKLSVTWRPGSHGTQAETIETYLDWLDAQFGRGRREFPERYLHPTFQRWKALSGENLIAARFPSKGIEDLLVGKDGNPVADAEAWRVQREEILGRIRSFLGDEPPAARNPGGDYGGEEAYRAALLGRSGASRGVERRSRNFGDYIPCDIYAPEGAGKSGEKLPAAVWLHPVSCSNGYVAGYRRGEHVPVALAREGFAVLAYDQIGFGARIEEGERFYERFPRWSLLGKMVRDARAAVDLLAQDPLVDRGRIFLLGHSLGGTVALHAAALDERIAGVVSVAGFAPIRLERPGRSGGAVQRLARDFAILPRLGFFEGEETRVPYDLHEVLACVAPRPLLAVTPVLDRENPLENAAACLDEAEKVYGLLGAKDRLRRFAPDDYNRYSPELQAEVNRRLKEIAGPAPRG